MIYNRPLQDYYSFSNSSSLNDEFIPFLLGRNAFNYLISSLEIKTILLPSFICSMVVDIFKNAGVEIIFYENLDHQLKFSIKPVIKLLKEAKDQDNTFFLWHDYLSLLGDIPDELYEILENNNTPSIIDATHSLPSKKYKCQNVVFGFRKLLNQPFGAFLRLDKKNHLPNNEIPFIKIIKFIVHYKIQTIIFATFKRFNNTMMNTLLKKLSIFGGFYSFDKNDYFVSDNFNYKKILKLNKILDYNKISEKRRKNFFHYSSGLSHNLNLDNFDTDCPYGFPFIVENNKNIRNKLWNEGIHSFILWGYLHEDFLQVKNTDSENLSKSIVVLPVNHDLTSSDINRVIEIINA